MYDSAKREVQRKFLREFGREVAEICKKQHIGDVYLFCTDFMMERVRKSIPDAIRKNIRLEYPGSMQYHSPVKLLEIIQEKQDEKRELNTIRSPEELRILGNR